MQQNGSNMIKIDGVNSATKDEIMDVTTPIINIYDFYRQLLPSRWSQLAMLDRI